MNKMIIKVLEILRLIIYYKLNTKQINKLTYLDFNK